MRNSTIVSDVYKDHKFYSQCLTVALTRCLPPTLPLSVSIFFAFYHPHLNVHLSFFRQRSVARNAFIYTDCWTLLCTELTILCFIEFCISAYVSFSLTHTLFLFLSLSLFSTTLMLMILWVFDKPNDGWKWQYQTWKSSVLPFWLLYAE